METIGWWFFMNDYENVKLSHYTLEMLKQFRLEYYQVTGKWLINWNEIIQVMCTTIEDNNIL